MTEKVSGAVVVGVDGSDASQGALEWAAEQALLEDRPLTVVHAATLGTVAALDLDAATIAAVMHAEGRAVLQRACSRAEELGVEQPRSELVMDDPRSALLAASRRAFLLVLGSRGRGPVTSLLLGSVGVALTQHARCPVVVRRPHAERAAGSGILVGTDGLPHSEPALEWAYHQALLRRMPLTLLRSTFDGRPARTIDDDEPGYDVVRSQLRGAAQRLAVRHPGVAVTLRLERGLADESLLRASAGMDMVVLGAHVRRSVLGLLDLDVATRTLERAPCLVAVVPGAE